MCLKCLETGGIQPWQWRGHKVDLVYFHPVCLVWLCSPGKFGCSQDELHIERIGICKVGLERVEMDC